MADGGEENPTIEENGNVREPRYFRNVHEVLPDFDPVKGNLSISQWIDKIEEHGEIYDWDDISMRHFALSKLCGVAKSWRDSLPRKVRNWQDWCKLLRENFPCDESEVIVRLEAQNYKRTSNQDIVEYFYEKLAKCNRAKMSEKEAIEWIVHGLNNFKFRDHLGPLSRYKKPYELLPDIKAASTYINDRFKEKSSWKDFNGGTNQKKNSENYQNNQKMSAANDDRNKNRTREIVCFKCQKKGHYARDCGRQKTEQAVVSSSSNGNPAVLQIGNDTHGKYFKDAFINGKPTKCYVDLGSSCVAIRHDILEEMGLAYYETDLEPLVGYGQGVVKPMGLVTVNLTIDGVSAKVKAHVVPNESQLVPVLVGHPYTEQSHVFILSTTNELKISTDISELMDIKCEELKKSKISTCKSALIPDNSLGHLNILSSFKNTTLCVEVGMREKGQVIPRCLITTDEEGESVLPVLNVSGKTLRFKEGDIITRGEVCEMDVPTPRQRPQLNEQPVTFEEVNTDLNREQAEDVVKLLNEQKHLIAREMKEIGLTDEIEMSIILKDDTPVYHRPYRMANIEKQQVKNIVQELKEADIIEDSNSPFASPVLLVKKKTGDMRMCIDYRAVNKQTVKDHYPIPLIDDQLDRMHGMKYFTSLDLSSGYYQVPMSSDSREKTAFITADGHYQFKRMPFGLCNAPSIFQRLINLVLGNLRYDVAMAYIDDIIIPSETINDGIEKLGQVLQALSDAGLTLNLKKCYFFMNEIEYLGFQISSAGIAPGARKMKSVKDFPTPTDVRSTRSFVGLASFFRRFVKNFAIIISPLTELLQKNSRFKWGKSQQEAFDKIKLCLTSKPILVVYNPSAKTEVHTDACAIGFGAVLLQEQTDGKLHPVSYFSRKTTKDESKYHSYELEALAIVSALERFRVYLLGVEFVIRTDCNSLKLLANKRNMSARIGRWFVRLSEFNYRIEYHKGTSNVVADSLSRNPSEAAEEVELVGLPVMGITINTDWIAALQRNDEEILAVKKRLEDDDAELQGKFTLYKGRVYKIKKGIWRLYVPKDVRCELVMEAHKSLMHLGIDKTLSKLKECYYFPKMREYVGKYINRCLNCLYYKTPVGKRPGFLHPLDKGNAPFQCVHIDHIGPYVATRSKNKFIISIVDGFSKYVMLKAARDTGSVSVLKFLAEFMSCFGKPLRIISDRGTAFTSNNFEEFCKKNEVQHVKVATSTPRANGQVERVNTVITTCLASSTDKLEGDDWDEKLYQVQWAINNSVHRVTRRTPHEIVFTHKGFGLSENPLSQEILALNAEIGSEQQQADVEELLKKNQDVMKARYDKNRREAPNYNENDLVLVRSEAASTGQSKKLVPKYRGPYEVVKKLDKDRYLIQDIGGERQSAKLYKGIIAVDRLKLVPKDNQVDE